MKFIELNLEQFEAALKYAMNFGAYQTTSGPRALYAARQAWEEMKRLGTPDHVLNILKAKVGKIT